MNDTNVDAAEIAKFSALAHKWWDPDSEFKPLHDINPARLDLIERHAGIAGQRILDVGCGGGILSEAMAARGGEVTGIDLAEKSLKIAKLHLFESGQKVDYRNIAVETLAGEVPQSFDVVTCMEMLEHVPDASSIINACAQLAKPGGWVFFSTLNRNPKSYLLAVLGAEYVLGLLPRGTHDYTRFLKPSELARMTRAAGLETIEVAGMHYNPFSRAVSLDRDASVNYLAACRKPA
ncbi:MAG: bifunctional 3-demethylubiquinol 3-O-methyltransferase/2-polyprenyl-6-hydroxyphenol methylase [Proteobacteria bacterium]|nr:bifunctional 3-demethylubiquinol 3-O-methyltransferase/2-polyprenyl-6-hydroxyphenol methylase [Pseudomonadota bacterium]